MLKVIFVGSLAGFGFSKVVVNFGIVFLGNTNNLMFAYNLNIKRGLLVLGFVIANGVTNILNKSLNYILYYNIICLINLNIVKCLKYSNYRVFC